MLGSQARFVEARHLMRPRYQVMAVRVTVAIVLLAALPGATARRPIAARASCVA